MGNSTLEFLADVDLAEFLSVQAHDLRSPFNHLVGFSKIMLNGQDGPLSELQREDLTTVYRSGLRALGLMSNLIDIARFSRGEKDLRPADVDAKGMLEGVIAQWKKSNPGRDLQFEYRLGLALPAVRVDDVQMRQLLGHLASYAAEYVEPPARVVLAIDDADGGWLFTAASIGERTRLQSDVDLRMLGYLGRALIELHGGALRQAEAGDQGATISFFVPKGTAAGG